MTGTQITGWNDGISSMKIYKSASFVIVGTWELIGSINGPLERQVQVGTTTTQTTESSTTVTDSFAVSMEEGVEFEGLSAKVSMTAEESTELKNTVTDSLSKT
jgi:hypothetical protein